MKHTTILVSAVLAGAALSAHAIEARDSSQFTYKYEMDALPTTEDVDNNSYYDFTGINAGATWCTLGTGSDSGTITMNMTGGQNLTSSAKEGNNGDLWPKLGVHAGELGTGYTVEVRLKVISSTGSKGALVLNASTGDTTQNSWLVFKSGKLAWGFNRNISEIADIDEDWHTYRLVREPGALVHSVWMDGVLLGSNFGDGIGANNLNRLLLGSANNDYAGQVQVDYLRFTKGAYVPVPTPKASINFPVKYEMDANDTRISISGNASDWTISGYSGATIDMNGVLSVVPNGQQTYWRTTDSAWKNLVTANTAFTVEFAAKINSCTLGNGDRTLQFWAATPRATGSGVLNIGMNHVYWQPSSSMDANIELDSSDNSDHKHVFRITYDGASSTGFTVWRDGVKIGENLGGNQTWTGANFNMVRFGIPGTTVGGAFNIYYIRWDTTGAYDWKESVRPFTLVVR